MEPIKILVADDNLVELSEIRKKLLSYTRNEITFCPPVFNRADCFESIIRNQPDIAFIDIRMEDGQPDFEIAGFTIAERLYLNNYYSTALVFVTNYDNTTNREKHFQLAGYNFIYKPLGPQHYHTVIDDYILDRSILGLTGLENKNRLTADYASKKSLETSSFDFKAQRRQQDRQLEYKNILYIQSAEYETTEFHCLGSDKPLLSRCRLKHWEDILPSSIFRKIHSSVIINVNYFSLTTGETDMEPDGVGGLKKVPAPHKAIWLQLPNGNKSFVKKVRLGNGSLYVDFKKTLS